MRKAIQLLLATGLTLATACAEDQTTAPRAVPQPTPAQVRTYIDNANRVAAAAEAYVRTYSRPGASVRGVSPAAMRARLAGLKVIAAEQRQLGAQAEMFAAGSGPALDILGTGVAPRSDGIINIIDRDNTWSQLNLDSRGDWFAFTHTFFPAQIDQKTSGTVRVGTTDWSVNHEEGTGVFFSTGYYGQFYIDAVQCWAEPAHGALDTEHSAGAQFLSTGFKVDAYHSQADASCDPQHLPCYTMPGLTGGGHIIPPGGVDNYPAYSESYDPYAEGGTADGTCDSSGGSSGAGDGSASGTPFHPGDSTGGETVSWSTGQGNGGSSACGGAAVVEFACIEQWTSNGWETWGCGYVTTC
jgi:hypothetical protein